MKKAISLLLSLCMILSLLPALGTSVLAGGGTTMTVFYEDFERLDETGISRWSFGDTDGRQNGWISTINTINFNSYSSECMISCSYIKEDQKQHFGGNYGIQNPDNALISPEIEIPEGYVTTLTFDVFAVDPAWAAEKYTVYFQVGDKSEELYTERLTSEANMENPHFVTVNLTRFAGQTGKIVFRHHDTSDQYIIGLDNVRIMASEIEEVTLEIFVVNGGYANAGTVIGAGTYPAGTQVTVTAQPNDGFGFWGWSNEGDALITEDLRYTFTITEDTLLIADFFKAPFEDICGTDYFFDAVLWAVEEGITTGTSATKFSPKATCTRAQVLTFLWRSLGSPMPHSNESPFTDVTGGEYYYDAVMWAVGSGITTGTSDTTFSPKQGCTRAQVLTFIWRACGKPSPSSDYNPFTDVDPSDYYYEPILWAVEEGLTTGTSATTFSPKATCTRAQIVTFLYRSWNR